MRVFQGFYYYSCLFSLLVILLVLQRSNCATVVVDGVNQWSNPTANIGDTIIFKHKNEYNLYIFRTKDAFNSCNFTQATPLSNPNNSTYTWHPSRTGNFYFAFYNGTTIPCQQGQKLAVKITPTSTTPPHAPPRETPPAATPGGMVASSPAYPLPFQPRESPGPAYNDVGLSPIPAMAPGMGSIPFINSNPAVPLPTGEVDSATIQPLPTSANHASKGIKVTGLIEGVKSLCYVVTVVVIVISSMCV